MAVTWSACGTFRVPRRVPISLPIVSLSLSPLSPPSLSSFLSLSLPLPLSLSLEPWRRRQRRRRRWPRRARVPRRCSTRSPAPSSPRSLTRAPTLPTSGAAYGTGRRQGGAEARREERDEGRGTLTFAHTRVGAGHGWTGDVQGGRARGAHPRRRGQGDPPHGADQRARCGPDLQQGGTVRRRPAALDRTSVPVRLSPRIPSDRAIGTT